MNKFYGVILVGIYASGKNTLVKAARRLTDPFHHFSSGEHFRTEIKMETPLGLLIQDDVASGQYVSDPTVIAVCEQELPKIVPFNSRLWLDGVPRTPTQVEFLFGDFFPRNGISIEDFRLVHITTSAEECELRARMQHEDPERSDRPDSALESALSRIHKDLLELPAVLDRLAGLIPTDQQFAIDGTNMRQDAPGFLEQIGLSVDQEKKRLYLEEIAHIAQSDSERIRATA